MKKFLAATALLAVVATGISSMAHAQGSVTAPVAPTVAATPSVEAPMAPVVAPAIGQPIESKAKTTESGVKEKIKGEHLKGKKIVKEGVEAKDKKIEDVKTSTDTIIKPDSVTK